MPGIAELAHPAGCEWGACSAEAQSLLTTQVSNFEYLMYLNREAGRSFKDLTQYPVFPWVVADWTSTRLDLSRPSTFR